MKLNKSMLVKRIAPTLLISAILPFIVFLSVPFEIYANNYSEFIFSFSEFFPVAIGFFFLFMTFFFFVLFFLPKKAYRIVGSVLIALAFLIFFQGNYLNGKMNSLSGDNVGSTIYSTTAVVFDTIFWVAVIAIAVTLACLKDKKGIISIIGIIVSVIILATQIITPVSLSFSKKEMFVSAAERTKEENESSEHYILSTKNINTVSTSSNVYIFCIDRFDESFAEEAFENNPEIYNSLTGFTWFQDHISHYGHTYPAVADMLTNNGYDSEKYRNEYLNSTYNNNKTLSVLNEKGYDINLYTQLYYAYTDAYNLPSYVKNREKPVSHEISDKAGLLFSVVNMALYRGLPLLAKNLFAVDSSSSNGYVIESTADSNTTYSSRLSSIKEQFVEPSFTETENKQFSFIHTDGCHDSTKASSSSKLVEKNFEVVNKYISILKEKGLYKDATIIVTGDHGLKNGSFTEVSSPTLTALFVKPSGVDEGGLKTSKAQTSHGNLWATIMKSEGIETENDYGESVFDIPEGENRERYFVWHTWGNKLGEYTYKIVGNGKDFKNWQKVSEKTFDRKIMD